MKRKKFLSEPVQEIVTLTKVSSCNHFPHKQGIIANVLAVMYKRSYLDEDPYVNIGDHPIDVMYAEVSYPHHNQLVKAHGGMDVFIKIKPI